MLTVIFKGILSTSLAVSPIILLILVCAPLISKYYKASVGCTLWLVIAVRLLVPAMLLNSPLLAIPAGEALFYLKGDAGAVMRAFAEAEKLQGLANGEALLQNANVAISPFGIAAMVWFAGAVLFAAMQIVTYIYMHKKLLRWCTPIKDEHTITVFESCKKEQGIQKNIAISKCTMLTTPLLMGFFFPHILLPDTYMTEMQSRYVFMHELAHFRRRDLWVKLLLLAAASAHWFNPLVWVAVKKAEVDIELACDADVLKVSGYTTRREYGSTILAFIEAKNVEHIPLTTNFFENHKQIIRRFEKIMDTKAKRGGMLCVILTVTSAILSITLVGCVSAQAATQEVGTSSVEESVISLAPTEPAADLGNAELKELYLANPEKYQAEQAELQKEISRIYEEEGETKLDYTASKMLWPVPEHYTITEPYGWRYNGSDYHTGIDISDESIDGQPVIAVSDGKVLHINMASPETSKGYGTYIILEHGGSVSTVYGHLGEVNVAKGDTVKAGQVIGKVGSTGFTKEPQLHFEVREKGNYVDVKPYMLPEEKAA